MSPGCNAYVRWLTNRSSLHQSFLLHSEEKPSDPDTFPVQSRCASEKLAMLVVYTLFESSPKELGCLMHGRVSKGAPRIILATFRAPCSYLKSFCTAPLCFLQSPDFEMVSIFSIRLHLCCPPHTPLLPLPVPFQYWSFLVSCSR